MSLQIQFTGLEARRHHIEANDGLESLAGLTHAATLVAHYVSTGAVRQRQPYDDRLRFFLERVEPGSLTVILSVGGSLAMSVAGSAVYDVLKDVWKKATGTGTDGSLQIGDRLYPAGDLEALSEAISPSLLRGHSWIGHPDQNVSIKTGRQLLLDLNGTTKSFLKTEIMEETESTQDVSVAALNANSKNGRVFFFDLGRTIPFKIDKSATPRTTANLSRYLTHYVNRNGATVTIRFKKIFHEDGRLKRIIIYDCYGI